MGADDEPAYDDAGAADDGGEQPDVSGAEDYAGQCQRKCNFCELTCILGERHVHDGLRHWDGAHYWAG